MRDRDQNKKVITNRIACGRPAPPGPGGHPSVLDYFEITGVEQDPKTGQFEVDNDAMQRLLDMGPRYATKQGDLIKAKRVPVRLASDVTADSLVQAYRSRTKMPVKNADGSPKMIMKQGDSEASQLMRLAPWCEGDGQTAMRLTASGDRVSIPCRASPRNGSRKLDDLVQILSRKAKHEPESDTLQCPWAQNASLSSDRSSPEVCRKSPVCKPETVLISHCDVVSAIGSFARFRSHGHNTADLVALSLKDIKDQLGFLAGVPLDLVLQMKRPRPGARLAPVVHLELRLTVEATVQLLHDNLKARTAIMESHRLLAAARAEAETDADAIDAEFTPRPSGEGGAGLKVS